MTLKISNLLKTFNKTTVEPNGFFRDYASCAFRLFLFDVVFVRRTRVDNKNTYFSQTRPTWHRKLDFLVVVRARVAIPRSWHPRHTRVDSTRSASRKAFELFEKEKNATRTVIEGSTIRCVIATNTTCTYRNARKENSIRPSLSLPYAHVFSSHAAAPPPEATFFAPGGVGGGAGPARAPAGAAAAARGSV